MQFLRALVLFTFNSGNAGPGGAMAMVLLKVALCQSAGNLQDYNPDKNPERRTRRYLPIGKERKEREEWGVAAR